MVHPRRFELLTFALEGRCSIQLSYGCIMLRCMFNIKCMIGKAERERSQIAAACPPFYPSKLQHSRKLEQLKSEGVSYRCTQPSYFITKIVFINSAFALAGNLNEHLKNTFSGVKFLTQQDTQNLCSYTIKLL
jgi:hypothetical protein